ncbi:hypothetical protein AWQ21_15495 (plasmid) [Picosynechococcus sp. PCC 7003]|nr:hypothetical protein AWQ21_15495 [Picosynechococcus sp. PCC 7003]
MPQPLKWSISIVFLFTVLITRHHAPARPAYNSEKIYGLWLTDVSVLAFTYTSFLDEVLHGMAGSGYDRVYFSVYGYRGQLYPNKERPDRIPELPFFRPLQSMAKESRRQGLKPFAWFEFGLMLPADDALAKKHPDWLLKLPDGTTAIENTGIQTVWLDPAHPEVQAYILSHMNEILKAKDLAGIQLDDHWAIPREFGEHRAALTALTQKVHDHIKAKNPELILSLSPNAYDFSREKYNQDWLPWVQQGLVDEVVIQVYRPTPEAVAQTIKTSGIETAAQYVPVGIGLYTGYRQGQPFTPDAIDQQIEVVEQKDFGYALFSWEYLALRYLFSAIPK